jgi:hypothetical protein
LVAEKKIAAVGNPDGTLKPGVQGGVRGENGIGINYFRKLDRIGDLERGASGVMGENNRAEKNEKFESSHGLMIELGNMEPMAPTRMVGKNFRRKMAVNLMD